MKRLTEWLDRRFYPGVTTNWADSLFREVILRRINRSARLLELGAGAGIIPEMNFKGLVGCICGLDPDPRVLQNPYLDDSKIGFADRVPYRNSEFDAVIANNFLEHLEKPVEVFHEIARVLKPGGLFIAKTPNRNHYVPAIARLTPVGFHRYYGRLMGRQADDTFPTVYRANSQSQIEALARSSGLRVESVRLIERRPEYLRVTPFTYLLGIAYERTVNSTPIFSKWRILLIVELRKLGPTN